MREEAVDLDLETLKKDLSAVFDATLKAELTGLELRLVDRIAHAMSGKADSATVADHDRRLTALETTNATHDHVLSDVIDLKKRVTLLERFRYAIPSVAFVSLILSAVVVLYYIVHWHPAH